MSAHTLTATEHDHEAQHPPATGRRLALLTLTALGVVYGEPIDVSDLQEMDTKGAAAIATAGLAGLSRWSAVLARSTPDLFRAGVSNNIEVITGKRELQSAARGNGIQVFNTSGVEVERCPDLSRAPVKS